MYQNMMGSPGAPFGGPGSEVQPGGVDYLRMNFGMPTPAPRPMPMPGYGNMGRQISGLGDQMPFGGMPNFGGGPMPVPPGPIRFMGSLPGPDVYADALRRRADRAREFGFGNGGGGGGFYQPEMTAMPMPGYGFNPQPDDGLKYGIMPISGPTYRLPDPGYGGRPTPGYGFQPRPMPQPTYRPGGFPQPDGGGAMNPGFGGGMMPQPDGGGEMNPGYAPIPQRTFNNNNPFYNAKGNLRMKWRDGFGAAGMDPSDAMFKGRTGQYDFNSLKRQNDQMAWDMQNFGEIRARPAI